MALIEMDHLWSGNLLSVLLGALVLVLLGLLVVREYRQRRFYRELQRLEEQVAKAISQPGLALGDLPAELNSIDADLKTFRREHEAVVLEREDLRKQLQNLPSAPDDRKLDVLILCIDDILGAIPQLLYDQDFEQAEEKLSIRQELRRTKDVLTAMRGSTRGAGQDFLRRLEDGAFNFPLTLHAFIEAYFANPSAEWHGFRVAVRAMDAMFEMLLQDRGVQLIPPPFLVRVPASKIGDLKLNAKRDIRTIDRVRRLAARMARDLDADEYLIVDCDAPGWVVNGVQRQPALALFNRSSWT